MHLGYFVESLPTFVLREIEGLRARGIEVSVFYVLKAPNDYLVAPLESDSSSRNEEGFPVASKVVRSGMLQVLRTPQGMWHGVCRARELGANHRKLLRSAHFAREARRLGVTQLHGTFATWPAEHAGLVSAITGLPYSFSVHAYDLFLPNPGLAKKIEYASGIRAISRFNATMLRDRFPEAAARIEVVRLGVESVQTFRPQVTFCERDEAFRLVSVGRLVPKKGFEFAVEAVERLLGRGRKVHLTIVGDGPLRSELENQIHAKKWPEAFRLTGTLSNREVQHLLRNAHGAILACQKAADGDMDGIPVFLMEAMALGVPVISTRVSGIPELIESGRTGLLVEPEDVDALTDAVEQLIDDSQLRFRLAAGAIELVRLEYNLDRQVDSFIGFLKRIENKGSSAPRNLRSFLDPWRKDQNMLRDTEEKMLNTGTDRSNCRALTTWR
jgi:colanic acid/amylovoran biosynthesis glycosyltransferase